MQGIWAKSVTGRPSRLTAAQKRRLERILLKGAASSGFSSDLWTCPRIVQVIRAEFGISYHVDHVCRLLHNMGWSPQRPQRKAMERDEAEIMRWVREEWPRVKKKPIE
jgi:transposase